MTIKPRDGNKQRLKIYSHLEVTHRTGHQAEGETLSLVEHVAASIALFFLAVITSIVTVVDMIIIMVYWSAAK